MKMLTRRKAIDILKQPDRVGCNLIKANDEESNRYNQESIEALNMAIKALEHDTPMKVNVEKWIYTKCPNDCGYELSTHHGDGYYSIKNKPTFCPKCGQRLDWGCDDD